MIYPLVRFLMERARRSAALAESVLRTAAEEPTVFEGTGAATLEALTAGLGPILPACVLGDDAAAAAARLRQGGPRPARGPAAQGAPRPAATRSSACSALGPDVALGRGGRAAAQRAR